MKTQIAIKFMPYHHYVVLKVATPNGQLQVSDGPKPIL